ncbi:MAG: TAXI family TRAP transporter solute-binding subunit [Lachnospira sp.]|nr:TAXI family TRAP transporter solute-binding subunit [Lachnospira sp.]
MIRMLLWYTLIRWKNRTMACPLIIMWKNIIRYVIPICRFTYWIIREPWNRLWMWLRLVSAGTEKNAEEILKVSGITEELVKTVNMDYSEAVDKLIAGEIDAMFITSGIRTGIIEQLSKKCSIDVISIDEKCIEKMLTAYPLYERYTIPADTYTGQSEPVNTIGVRAVLVASANLSAGVTEQITSIIFSHSTDIKNATSLDSIFDVNAATGGIDIPFHAGAAAYYTKQGVSVRTE